MIHVYSKELTLAISAVSGPTITVSSTADVKVGARGAIINSGGTSSLEVVVYEVVNGTQIKVREDQSTKPGGKHYGPLSIGAGYVGGTFSQYRTLVPVDPAYAASFSGPTPV